MANTCGCANGRGIYIQGADPVLVSGQGIPGSPFIVSLEHNGKQGCMALVACLSDLIGSGLSYSTATDTIRVNLSQDPDNAIRFGSDGGLKLYRYGPMVNGCQEREDKVPATCAPGALLVGAQRMAGLRNPFSTPHGAAYALNLGCDILHMYVAASSDGVACVVDRDNGFVEIERYLINRDINVQNMTASQFQRCYNWAGDFFNPTMWLGATTDTSTNRQGGWWGWYSTRYHPPLLHDVLRALRGKIIVLADCSIASPSYELANVRAVMRAVGQLCWHHTLLVGVRFLDSAQVVRELGGIPIYIANNAPTKGSNVLPLAAAQFQGASSSFDWVAIDTKYDDSVFAFFQGRLGGDLALDPKNVLSTNCDRHFDRAKATRLGLCGYLSHDPEYTRGPVTGRDYRRTEDPTVTGQPGPGLLSSYTSLGTYEGLTDRDARGYSTTDGGLRWDRRWGNGGSRPSVTAGWACPLPTGSNGQTGTYTIRFQTLFTEAATVFEPNAGGAGSVKIGLLFGGIDDRDVFGEFTDGFMQLYRVYVRQTGTMGIGIFSTPTTYNYLRGDVASPTTEQSVRLDGLTTGTITPHAINTWYQFRLVVTPTTITFTRTTTADVPIAGATVTANSGPTAPGARQGPRGPYFYYEKEELGGQAAGGIRIVGLTATA